MIYNSGHCPVSLTDAENRIHGSKVLEKLSRKRRAILRFFTQRKDEKGCVLLFPHSDIVVLITEIDDMAAETGGIDRVNDFLVCLSY